MWRHSWRAETGGALQVALFVLVIVLSFSLLLLGQTNFARRAVGQSRAAILYRLNQRSLDVYLKALYRSPDLAARPQQHQLTLNGQAMQIETEPFGLFIFFAVHSRLPGMERRRLGLLANRAYPLGDGRTALVHMRAREDLAFAGSTLIRGDIYTRGGSFRGATLAGMPYKQPIPMEGRQKTYDRALTFATAPLLRSLLPSPAAEVAFGVKTGAEPGLYLNGGEVSFAEVERRGIKALYGPGILRIATQPPAAHQLRLFPFVRVIATSGLQLPATWQSAYCLFSAPDSLHIAGQHQSQFISPIIRLRSDRLDFPSALIGLPGQTAAFDLAGSVAGLIWLTPGPEAAARELRSRLQSSAAIPHRGAVICRQQINAALQLEGVLMLEQSYFYQSPTHYRNWLQATLINADSSAVLFPLADRRQGNRLEIIYEQNSFVEPWGQNASGQ
jgi:hypothetical protein